MPLKKTPNVVPIIFKDTTDPATRTAMVFGSGLESGWSDTARNPSGATGPYQILLSAHPGVTTQQAENPNFATQYMLSAYQQAVAQVPEDTWNTDPELAAEQAVIIAEKPGGPVPTTAIGPYGGEGIDVVNQRWGQTQQLLKGRGLSTANLGTNSPTAGTGGAAVTTSAIGSGYNAAAMGVDLATGDFPAFFSRLGDTLWNSGTAKKIALIAFGALVILMGMTKLGVHPVKAAKKAAGTATEVAGAVTGEPEVVAAGAGLKRGTSSDRED